MDMPPHLTEALGRLAFDFGDTYAAYLATERDREYFWSADRRGVVAFHRRGRFATVADGLLAAPVDRDALLKGFLAFAEMNRWHTSFVNVPRNEINLFRQHRCEVTKCGEEPLVQLQRVTWKGKGYEWARRQASFCKRHGVEIREIVRDSNEADYATQIAPQLDEISRDHIAHTLHRREMQFFVSQFSALDLRDRRLLVAELDGSVIAFIVCNPGLQGNLWAVEVYRRRHDAIRGVIPAVIMHTMHLLQDEGVEYFSLSLVPFLRCTPVMGDSAMFRTIANFWWRFLNPIYDVQGLFHFKSRFRPDYREMYLAAHPRITVRSLLVMAMTWQLFHFNPLRLAWRSLRRSARADRGGRSTPVRSTDRLIRRLRIKPSLDLAADSLLLATAGNIPLGSACQAHEKVPV
jgi:phosphatidylglycerol lysyltransferase